MRITFERTGGFAGMRLTKVFDTATLTTEEANRLRQLLDAADFLNLTPNITSSNSQPDRFQYKLTLEDDDRQHTVIIGEQAAPANLKPLLEWLKNRIQK